jgi:hypothetical protein
MGLRPCGGARFSIFAFLVARLYGRRLERIVPIPSGTARQFRASYRGLAAGRAAAAGASLCRRGASTAERVLGHRPSGVEDPAAEVLEISFAEGRRRRRVIASPPIRSMTPLFPTPAAAQVVAHPAPACYPENLWKSFRPWNQVPSRKLSEACPGLRFSASAIAFSCRSLAEAAARTWLARVSSSQRREPVRCTGSCSTDAGARCNCT